MKVVMCIVGGVPSSDNASARNLRALRWLSCHHDTYLLPIYLPNSHRPTFESAKRKLASSLPETGTATLLPSLTTSGFPSLRRARTSGSIARALKSELLSQVAGADWLWVSYPPLLANRELIATCERCGIRISWDWDCLSLLAARSARQAFPAVRSPLHALQLLSQVAYEFRYLRHLHALTVPALTDRVALERTTRREVHRLRAAIDVSQFADLHTALIDDIPTALFVGSSWPPNVHGIAWVIREVWPTVEQRMPQARLRVVGRGITPKLLPKAGPKVEIVGEVSDVREELGPAHVVLAPIFFGAGIPTKLLEAAASGKATLATNYCARVLGVVPFDVSDDASFWIRRLIGLLQDPDEARRQGADNLRFARDHWDEASWLQDMKAVNRLMSS